MDNQPRLFIASSKEGLSVAEAVNIKLDRDSRVTLWDNAFDLSGVTITELCKQTENTDFAVFVFHRDDEATIRGSSYSIVRDNVLFELGLFIGSLGVKSCFILAPRSDEDDFRLPTDLAGVTATFYDDTREDVVDAVSASCAKIKRAIRKHEERDGDGSGATVDSDTEDDQDQIESLESKIWRLEREKEMEKEEKVKIKSAVESYFYSVAKPATEAEVSKWEQGAKDKYSDNPEIRRHDVFFVDQDVIVPSLYGANAISIIVGEDVDVYGVEERGHNSIYYMDGFRMVE